MLLVMVTRSRFHSLCESPTCLLAPSCDKGAKGDACIKLDPKKGACARSAGLQKF